MWEGNERRKNEPKYIQALQGFRQEIKQDLQEIKNIINPKIEMVIKHEEQLKEIRNNIKFGWTKYSIIISTVGIIISVFISLAVFLLKLKGW